MRKIKVIIKRPDEEYGHVCHVSDRLENLQKIVGGYIQIVPVTDSEIPLVVICNEDGKNLGLPFNMRFMADALVGTVIVCGVGGENLTDIPIGLRQWKIFVDGWSSGI